MIYFVEYYQKSAISDNLIPACGDRAVIVLDGRNSLETMKQDARVNNGVRRPVYDAFKIHKGESFSNNCKSLTELIYL